MAKADREEIFATHHKARRDYEILETFEAGIELKGTEIKSIREGRVSIRTVRRDANEAVKKLKSDKQISEDEAFKAQEHVQKLTDAAIAQIDGRVKAKEQELQST